MPFCPICKSEYREGIKTCHECKAALVDDLEEGPQAVVFGEEERMQEFLDYCRGFGLTSGFLAYSEERGATELYVARKDTEKAADCIRTLLIKEEMQRLADKNGMDINEMTPGLYRKLKEEEEEELRSMAEDEDGAARKTVYEDKREKASEYRSSSVVLLLVGGVGLIALLLMYLGVIPGFRGIKSNYMLLFVMGALFLIFILCGIMSLQKVKTILLQADAEEALAGALRDTLASKLSKERIEEAVGAFGDCTGEELYFRRVEYMESVLKSEHPDAEDALLEKLIDEYYGVIYEDNNH